MSVVYENLIQANLRQRRLHIMQQQNQQIQNMSLDYPYQPLYLGKIQLTTDEENWDTEGGGGN